MPDLQIVRPVKTISGTFTTLFFTVLFSCPFCCSGDLEQNILDEMSVLKDVILGNTSVLQV